MRLTKLGLGSVLIFLCLLLGCSTTPPGAAQFVEITADHQMVCNETCVALIQSIQKELDVRTDLSDAQRTAYLDLISRLQYIQESSELIKRYTVATMVDEELFEEMLRVKIRGENFVKYGIKKPGVRK